jgi:hypothetical protein
VPSRARRALKGSKAAKGANDAKSGKPVNHALPCNQIGCTGDEMCVDRGCQYCETETNLCTE